MADQPPLRILHCFRSPVGGIFRHVRDLVREHHAAGHHIGIVCDNLTGGPHEAALFEELTPLLALGLVRMPIRRAIGLGDVLAMRSCYRHVKSLRPDVLHGHGAKGGAMARVIGSVLRVQGYRVARFYSPHGGSLHYRPNTALGRMVFFLERRLEARTDMLCFVCDYEAATYRFKVGVPRCRAEVIYNGLADQDFRPVPTHAKGVDFAYIGMMRDMKGPDVFIDAFQATERRLARPLTAVMIGDGPDRDRYERLITQRGLAMRISLMPAMRIEEALRSSDRIVVPSRADAMPYVVLEALAAGKTVLASRVGGIPEALGRDNPALVQPDDPAMLADRMALSIDDADWCASARPDPELFRERFSARTMASRLEAAYRLAVKADPPDPNLQDRRSPDPAADAVQA